MPSVQSSCSVDYRWLRFCIISRKWFCLVEQRMPPQRAPLCLCLEWAPCISGPWSRQSMQGFCGVHMRLVSVSNGDKERGNSTSSWGISKSSRPPTLVSVLYPLWKHNKTAVRWDRCWNIHPSPLCFGELQSFLLVFLSVLACAAECTK